jgi:amidase
VALLDQVSEQFPPPRYARGAVGAPAAAENPLGAWSVRVRVEGASRGPLAGRSCALKDNVMLAGVPMSNGTRLLEGYVPPVDATVATRILDAGATIVGKATCESWCLSAGSHTSESGPVRNPRDPARHAGGSSSGSAALVAAGEVDLAIGGDQGGSIRVPASFCGIVGLKPTHGLVPYTGVLSIEPTLDHVGPMTRRVAENALLLEAIAGPDGVDPRQGAGVRAARYTEALGHGVAGLRIGLLREGFAQPGAEPDVDAGVAAAVRALAAHGAAVTDVSIPIHRTAGMLLSPVFQSALLTMLHTDGCGAGLAGLYVPSLAERVGAWRERVGALSETMKVLLFATEHLRRRAGFRYYVKAMQLLPSVRAAYDDALRDVDVLALPTTPMKAPLLPPPGAPRALTVGHAVAPTANTQVFDHTHHPALSVPCGESAGLPIGLMLVGRAFDEATLYRVAEVVEAGRGSV